jgi:predicted secreted protein
MATAGILVDDRMKLFIDAVKFNHLTDFSISIGKETINVTSFDSQGWQDFIDTDKNWTASCTAFYAMDAAHNADDAFDDLNASGTNALLLSTEETGDTTYGGMVIHTQVEITGSKGSAMQCSISFQGTGALSKSAVT